MRRSARAARRSRRCRPPGSRPTTCVHTTLAGIRSAGYHGGRIGWPTSRIPWPRFRKGGHAQGTLPLVAAPPRTDARGVVVHPDEALAERPAARLRRREARDDVAQHPAAGALGARQPALVDAHQPAGVREQVHDRGGVVGSDPDPERPRLQQEAGAERADGAGLVVLVDRYAAELPVPAGVALQLVVHEGVHHAHVHAELPALAAAGHPVRGGDGQPPLPGLTDALERLLGDPAAADQGLQSSAAAVAAEQRTERQDVEAVLADAPGSRASALEEGVVDPVRSVLDGREERRQRVGRVRHGAHSVGERGPELGHGDLVPFPDRPDQVGGQLVTLHQRGLERVELLTVHPRTWSRERKHRSREPLRPPLRRAVARRHLGHHRLRGHGSTIK